MHIMWKANAQTFVFCMHIESIILENLPFEIYSRTLALYPRVNTENVFFFWIDKSDAFVQTLYTSLIRRLNNNIKNEHQANAHNKKKFYLIHNCISKPKRKK